MEHNAFRVPHLSDTLREAAFHGQAVKTVAYLRVSTPQQDVSSQRLAILEYAQKHDLHIDDFIEATASGQASEKRRRLDELTSALQPGDSLVVSELSRLGRSLDLVVAVLDALAKAGVACVALKENIRVEGKRDSPDQGHDHPLRAVRRGRARPDLRAHPRGASPRPGPRAASSGARRARWASHGSTARRMKSVDFLELGVSKTAIAKITGVFRTTLYSFMTTRRLRPSR